MKAVVNVYGGELAVPQTIGGTKRWPKEESLTSS